jgi:hypothetical protein
LMGLLSLFMARMSGEPGPQKSSQS